MAELEIKNKEGKKAGKATLSESLTTKASANLLHRAVVTEEANSRQGTQKTKTRSEVKGGGKKPYKQKKTGNARQGTTRAPQYAHGGMALAITPRSYEKKLNRKERRAAILGALAEKVEAGSVMVVDSISFTEPRTKNGVGLLKSMGLSDVRRVLVILPAHDEVTLKCFRNLPNVEVRTAPSNKGDEAKSATFSTRDVLVAHKILIAKDALARVEEAWSK